VITVAALIRRSLAANVEAGIGRWVPSSSGDLGRLGSPIYEYVDQELTFRLFERGLSFELRGHAEELAYTSIQRVSLANLAALAAYKRSGERIPLAFHKVGGVECMVPLPQAIYSAVATMLDRIVREFATRIR
jgi:hypothetical protein